MFTKRRIVVLFLAVALGLSLLLAGGVEARGYHGGYHGGWHGGYGFGPWWGYPYAYPYSYAYPYPYAYPSYPAYPDTQLPAPSEPQQSYWYYCKEPQGYYPHVQNCPGGWTQVTPTPPPSGKEGAVP